MARPALPVLGVECDAARERASLALDGALDDVGRRQLARHVARCAACAAVVDELGAVTALLRRAPLEAYRCELRPPARRAGRVAPWAASAAAVAALVVGIGSLPYATGPEARTSLTAADLGTTVPPVKLPIGQRSAEDDFRGTPVVLEA